MSTDEHQNNEAKQKTQKKLDHLTKRTIQVTGFGIAIMLMGIRIYASFRGFDSGISEFLIAGFAGMGASGSWIK